MLSVLMDVLTSPPPPQTPTSLTPQCATKCSKSCKWILTTFKMWISFKFFVLYSWHHCKWRFFTIPEASKAVVSQFRQSSCRFYIWVSMHHKSTIYNKPTRCNSGSIVFINNYRYALHVLGALCAHHQEHYEL